ncbi:serine hydrolase [Streptomyces monticola]|uniref:Serine hydrolase n=1 Tax=Streptomyces monticola TaxID=2666263 RepID=A0ABW2JL63_9ACTN
MAPHTRRTALVAAVAASTLLVPISAAAAVSDDRSGRRAATCRSARDPELAARMSKDLRAALSSRRGTVSLAVHDDNSDLWCALDGARRYDSASVAKVLIMETVLRRAQELRRHLTRFEARNVRPMITSSDNGAALRLWQDLGHQRLQSYLRKAGARSTTPGPYGLWGLTRTTAADQMRLLGVLSKAPSILRERARGLKLMSQVRPGQRWGVPAGRPRGVVAHLKNGWLPRATHGWRVHSVGVFTGAGRNYRIVALSHDNPTMAYGVRTIERIAHAVHRGLNKGRAAGTDYTPESEISEQSDGSVPEGLPDDFELPEEPSHDDGA